MARRAHQSPIDMLSQRSNQWKRRHVRARDNLCESIGAPHLFDELAQLIAPREAEDFLDEHPPEPDLFPVREAAPHASDGDVDGSIHKDNVGFGVEAFCLLLGKMRGGGGSMRRMSRWIMVFDLGEAS